MSAPTIEELTDALANAHKAATAGDATAAEHARQLADMIYAMQSKPTEPVKAPVNPAAAPSVAEKLYRGAKDPLDAAAQMFERAMPAGFNQANRSVNNWIAEKTGMLAPMPEGGTDALIRAQEAAYQAKRTSAGESGLDAWRLAGNVVSPVNLAIAAKAPQAASFAGRLASGVGSGALSGVLNPVTGEGDFWKEKAKQGALGATLGAAIPTVTGALSRVLSPRASVNPEVAMLKGEGVKPTLGQTLGGWANDIEEKMQSLPIMGDAIRSAREKAREQFNTAAINRATAPVGKTVTGAGHESVDEAHKLISEAYEAGKSQLGHFQIDNVGAQELQTLTQMATALPQREQRVFNDIMQTIRNDITPNGSILADGFKRIDSKLGKEAATFLNSTDAYQKKLGEGLLELQRVITENAKRANPQAAQLLNDADRAFANLVRVEGASKAAVNHKGVFTPSQLNLAVRGTDRSVRKNATARGEALMQDLSSAGQSVLGNKVADSGTTGRLLWGMGALGTGAISPSIPIGLGIGAAAYTSPVQAALRGAVSARPAVAKPVAEAVEKATPYLIPAGAEAGLRLMNDQ